MRAAIPAMHRARFRHVLCFVLLALPVLGCGPFQQSPAAPTAALTATAIPPSVVTPLAPTPAASATFAAPTVTLPAATSTVAVPALTAAPAPAAVGTPQVTSTPRATAVPAKSSGITLYVDGALAQDCADASYSAVARACSGSDGAAIRTVNAALNAATDGDTILVRQGTYLETGRGRYAGDISYFIDKQVVLKTYQREVVTLSFPPGHHPSWKRGDLGQLISITAPNVTLDGFTIIGTKWRDASVK